MTTFQHPPKAFVFPPVVPLENNRFGKALSGDITGDGVADLACLRGSSGVFVFGPNVYHGTDEALLLDFVDDKGVLETVADFDLLRNVGPSRAADVLTVGGDGLVQRRWEAGEFVRSVLAPWNHLKFVSVWQDPRSIFAHVAVIEHVQPPKEAWLVHTFLFVKSTGEFFASYPVQGLGLGPIHDLLLFAWDEGAEPAIAVVRDTELQVFDVYGEPLEQFPSFGTPGQVAPLHEEGVLRERLAWVVDSFVGPLLIVIDQTEIEATVNFGWDVIGVTAADADQDGDADVLVSQDSPVDLLSMYLNQPEQSRLGELFQQNGSVAVLDSSAAAVDLPTGLVTSFTFADVEQDGDADVIVLDDETARGLIYSGLCRDVASEAPDMEECAAVLIPPTENELGRFHLEIPVSVTAASAVGFNHLEVIAWPRLDDTDPLEGSQDFHRPCPLPARFPDATWETLVDIDLPVPELPEHATSWAIEFRLAYIDDAEPRRAAPPAVLAFNLLEPGEPPSDDCPSGIAAMIGGGVLRGDFIPLGGVPPMGEIPMQMQLP